MVDHAVSSDPAVQAQLDRLWALSPGADVLGLERITRLLARIGNPHHALPPVFHVAGTNGKGSTCAYLRAALEASGRSVHVYTSPHLVRFNERIRLAGRLIDDAALAALLAEVLDSAGGIGASFFEVTTAAAFLAFARTPADACIVEVGLGGRLDATNVVRSPAVCGIAALGIDHEAFLGDTLPQIAAEKAGIAKPGVPLVTMHYVDDIAAVIERSAADHGAILLPAGRAWQHGIDSTTGRLRYRDGRGELDLPPPSLPGVHQADNLALAVAMLRHQEAVAIEPTALATAATAAHWPARLQRLRHGPLTAALGGSPVWLDGGHNPSAGQAIAVALDVMAGSGDDRSLTLILGMLANKDAAGFVAPFASRVARVIAVPVPGHDHHDATTLHAVARSLGVPHVDAAVDVRKAITMTGEQPDTTVLIAGSLYLAGEVLRQNDEMPD